VRNLDGLHNSCQERNLSYFSVSWMIMGVLMELDYARGDAKRAELEKLIVEKLPARFMVENIEGDEKTPGEKMPPLPVSEILNAGCIIEPPEKKLQTYEQFRAHLGGLGGAQDVKLGNILLDTRKLVATVAKVTLMMGGAIASPWTPWTIPLAFLVLWDELWSRMKVDVQEREATVMLALWMNCDSKTLRVPKDRVLNLVNGERAQYRLSELTSQELDLSLEMLVKMGCIKEAWNDRSIWWIRDQVKVTFN
jgi:hypothetical protein